MRYTIFCVVNSWNSLNIERLYIWCYNKNDSHHIIVNWPRSARCNKLWVIGLMKYYYGFLLRCTNSLMVIDTEKNIGGPSSNSPSSFLNSMRMSKYEVLKILSTRPTSVCTGRSIIDGHLRCSLILLIDWLIIFNSSRSLFWGSHLR